MHRLSEQELSALGGIQPFNLTTSSLLPPGSWQKLFSVRYEKFHKLFANITISKLVQLYLSEQECPADCEGRPLLWKALYIDLRQAEADSELFKLLQRMITSPNGRITRYEKTVLGAVYELPYLSIFLALCVPRFRSLVATGRSNLFSYLPIKPERAQWEFERGYTAAKKRLINSPYITEHNILASYEATLLFGQLEGLRCLESRVPLSQLSQSLLRSGVEKSHDPLIAHRILSADILDMNTPVRLMPALRRLLEMRCTSEAVWIVKSDYIGDSDLRNAFSAALQHRDYAVASAVQLRLANQYSHAQVALLRRLWPTLLVEAPEICYRAIAKQPESFESVSTAEKIAVESVVSIIVA